MKNRKKLVLSSHTISGMYINVDSTKAFAVGFFGKVIGKIQNLSLIVMQSLISMHWL